MKDVIERLEVYDIELPDDPTRNDLADALRQVLDMLELETDARLRQVHQPSPPSV